MAVLLRHASNTLAYLVAQTSRSPLGVRGETPRRTETPGAGLTRLRGSILGICARNNAVQARIGRMQRGFHHGLLRPVLHATAGATARARPAARRSRRRSRCRAARTGRRWWRRPPTADTAPPTRVRRRPRKGIQPLEGQRQRDAAGPGEYQSEDHRRQGEEQRDETGRKTRVEAEPDHRQNDHADGQPQRELQRPSHADRAYYGAPRAMA